MSYFHLFVSDAEFLNEFIQSSKFLTNYLLNLRDRIKAEDKENPASVLKESTVGVGVGWVFSEKSTQDPRQNMFSE